MHNLSRLNSGAPKTLSSPASPKACFLHGVSNILRTREDQ